LLPFVEATERDKGGPIRFYEATAVRSAEDSWRKIEMATKNDNPGNFANDREKASEAGSKGGHNSGGNFANDRERASEAGRKGGSK
jgi:general stress protein YciG